MEIPRSVILFTTTTKTFKVHILHSIKPIACIKIEFSSYLQSLAWSDFFRLLFANWRHSIHYFFKRKFVVFALQTELSTDTFSNHFMVICYLHVQSLMINIRKILQ